MDALKKVARKQGIALIDVQTKLPSEENKEYFCDYCHPLEPASALIVEDFLEIARTSSAHDKPKKSRAGDSRNATKEIYPLW